MRMARVRYLALILLLLMLVLTACGSQSGSQQGQGGQGQGQGGQSQDQAQEQPAYPEKPITMIVPFGAGGPSDQLARTLAEHLKEHLPQPVVIVNREGGGGSVGAAELVRAKPDGYTIGLPYETIMTLQPHLTDVPYKGPEDYIAVMELVNTPLVLAIRADVPWQTVDEFVEYAKAHPGEIRVATAGLGSGSHIAVEKLKAAAGIELTTVPFASGSEEVAALLGGHVEAASVNPPVVLGQVQAGQARILATFEEERNPLLPDVPTFREEGVDAVHGNNYLLVLPKGSPEVAVKTLHDAFKKVLDSQGFVEWAQQNGFVISYKDTAQVQELLKQSYEFYGELAKKVKFK